jgi:hypothetical protein
MVEAVRRHHEIDVRTGLAGTIAASSRLAHRTDFTTGTLAEDGLAILEMIGLTPENWQTAIGEVGQNNALLSIMESNG